MWVAIIVISLAVAMMLGPIMFMQPSRRQRRLAKLRATAEQQGLKVRMAPMPDGAVRAGETLAFYYRSWQGQKGPKDSWILARQLFAHELHFFEDWDWVNRRSASPGWQSAIRLALPELPHSVLAVEANSQSLGVYWLEETADKTIEQAVSEISTWLKNRMAEAPRRG